MYSTLILKFVAFQFNRKAVCQFRKGVSFPAHVFQNINVIARSGFLQFCERTQNAQQSLSLILRTWSHLVRKKGTSLCWLVERKACFGGQSFNFVCCFVWVVSLVFTLQEEVKLQVFVSKVLRMIFWPKWDGVTGEWRSFRMFTAHLTLFDWSN